MRDELEIFEHEFRIHAVAGWFVDGVSAEAPIKFVFEIVVRAKFPLGAIWRERYGGQPPFGELGAHFKPLVDVHGLDAVAARFRTYVQAKAATR